METKITDCAANKGWQTGEEFAAHQFVVAFNEMQAKANRNAHNKGWYESKLRDLVIANSESGEEIDELNAIEDARRIALAHAEASEGLEGLRHGNKPSDHIPEFSAIEEEYADVVIRLMDHSQERGWRLADAIVAKMRYNATRPHRHGGKRF